MKHVFLTLIIPILSLSQGDNLQTFGTVSHFLISCPCKLLKYYEEGKLYYYCEDKSYQTKYVIKEIKHKDGLDLILNALNKNIYSKKTKNNDSLISIKHMTKMSIAVSTANFSSLHIIAIVNFFYNCIFYFIIKRRPSTIRVEFR